jgi:acyl carrier protein
MPEGATMNGTERAVAREIVRVAREELQLEPAALGFAEDADGGAGEVLAAALDSLQLLSLVVAVEDRFRIVLAEEDAAGTRTLADLARLVAARAEPAVLPAAGEGAP